LSFLEETLVVHFSGQIYPQQRSLSPNLNFESHVWSTPTKLDVYEKPGYAVIFSQVVLNVLELFNSLYYRKKSFI